MKKCGFANSALFLLILVTAVGCARLGRADEPSAPKPAASDKRTANEPKTDGAAADSESATADPQTEADTDEEYYELLRLFADTLDQVERNYVQDLSRRELMEAAIQGMLSKLDEHSNYIPPAELDRFRSDVEAEFGGIGIQVSKPTDKHELRIISPLPGTPAYRAGIVAGDVITHIGDKPTEGMPFREAVRKLKGKAGTSVAITLRRADGKSRRLKVTREVVRVETVLGDRRKADSTWEFMYDREHKIGYVRISAFARNTTRELQAALASLQSEGMQGLVLDLRSNPGGLLSSAIQVSDMFIREGRIVSTSGRNVRERSWDAHRRGTYEGFPIAILVNRFSASASEIVSACLQDHGRSIVIGERTFGKGSVQNIIELESGRSALKLTTAEYRRPNGKNIHRFEGATDDDEWGVHPDDGYEVKLTLPELRRRHIVRAERDIIRPAKDPADPADARDPADPPEFVDKALDKALAYLVEAIGEADDNTAAEAGKQPNGGDQAPQAADKP